jgi:hypothetical protein
LTMPWWNDDTPLGEVRDWLRIQVKGGDAVECPCCAQNCKIYRRSLPNATARVMIVLWRRDEGRGYTFLPDMLDALGMTSLKGTPHQGGYGVIGHHWNLMEHKPGKRPDKSPRNGYWRLTDLGRDFVQEKITVQKYAHVYAGRCLKLSGPPWSIRDALGSKFRYDDLMRGV